MRCQTARQPREQVLLPQVIRKSESRTTGTNATANCEQPCYLAPGADSSRYCQCEKQWAR